MSNIKGASAQKHGIYIVGGEKGGVGKSFFARCLLEYFTRKKWTNALTLIEADPTIGDVGAVYKEKCKQVRFSDSKYLMSEPLEIFKTALERTVLVNLPSNVSHQFDLLIGRTGVLDKELRQHYGEMIYFFVSDGCYQSLELFRKQVVKYSGKQLQHILVFNPARLTCAGWFDFLEVKYTELLDVIKDYQIPVLCCPELSTDLQFECDRNGWTYSDAIEQKEYILEKQRIKVFLDRLNGTFDPLFESIDRLKIESLIEEQKTQRESKSLPIPSREAYYQTL